MAIKAQDFQFVADLARRSAAIVIEPGKEYLVESRLTPLAQKEGFDSLEQAFLTTTPALSRWQSTDSTLVLFGDSGVAVRLRAGQN